ncbi:putative LRR receptor-like serine/threonine-protein kinase [Camellia lanceoleosa]|uniref:LRR receptor-like serine/threonine-protein kinase n=1 Tax=Camellia lanceoleosa TaxID=1840588 RepID=A0ACC0I344_9ERIC|nr:putative LRR receptor-like serine/threonine-protein kinase [Camellia lanceoleosa]
MQLSVCALFWFGSTAIVCSEYAGFAISRPAVMGTMDLIIDTVSAPHPLVPLVGLLKSHGKLILVVAPEKPLKLQSFFCSWRPLGFPLSLALSLSHSCLRPLLHSFFSIARLAGSSPKLPSRLLDNNNLTGHLPPEFNIPELRILQLDNNNFNEAEIPASYGNLSTLLKLSLTNCSLHGALRSREDTNT